MPTDPTDAEREALASCPFCGSDAYPASSGLTNWIECRHCHASSGSGSNASALWNRRSPASLVRAWEMGRDAALNQLLPMIPVGAERDARRFIAALTPETT